MLRYKTKTKPGLVALYDIRPGNWAGPFLQPRSLHGAWKNRRTHYNCRFYATSLALRVIFVCWKHPPIYYYYYYSVIIIIIICVVHGDLGLKNQTTRYNRFWRAGCSQLEYIDIRSVY